jgi:fructose-1,6-bisphosphatase/sedoheptulose 1,7-bisphosphatase-like protein
MISISESAHPLPRMTIKLEHPMVESCRIVERNIADLRELMRCTLDRTKHPHIRERIMAEMAKLKALGVDEVD